MFDNEELLLFFSTIEDTNHILNLMKYINGMIDDYQYKDDLVKKDYFIELYSRCTEAITKIVDDTETDTHQPPPPKPFVGAKLIEAYDPIKVHKEFKTELKCDYSTFKAWFIDSVICDKQMCWKYDKENKTQLRSFIYVLCGGWKPAETNTAFKITVNSNDREGKLNSNLLQRIEKCTVE